MQGPSIQGSWKQKTEAAWRHQDFLAPTREWGSLALVLGVAGGTKDKLDLPVETHICPGPKFKYLLINSNL